MLLQMALFILFYGWLILLYVCVCIYIIHSSVNGHHLGCFHALTVANSAAMNTGVHVSFWIRVFSRYVFRSGLSRSHGKSMFNFFYYYFFYCSGFCHTLKWNSHGFTCVPHPDPPPPPSPPDPSRFSQCTRSERLSHASNLGWWSVSP